MKNILIIMLLTLVVGLGACKKENQCWECSWYSAKIPEASWHLDVRGIVCDVDGDSINSIIQKGKRVDTITGTIYRTECIKR